jgi:hypothetical protein
MFSMGIVLVIQESFMGRVEIAPPVFPQFITSSRVSFAIFALLCLAGVFAALARGRLKKAGPESPSPQPAGNLDDSTSI